MLPKLSLQLAVVFYNLLLVCSTCKDKQHSDIGPEKGNMKISYMYSENLFYHEITKMHTLSCLQIKTMIVFDHRQLYVYVFDPPFSSMRNITCFASSTRITGFQIPVPLSFCHQRLVRYST